MTGTETFATRLRTHARQRRGVLALAVGDTLRSWGELEASATRISADLVARGIGPGSRIALLCDPGCAFVEALLGVVCAGASVVPLPTGQPAPVLTALLRDSAARLIAVSASQRPQAEQALAGCAIEHRVGLDFTAPGWQRWRQSITQCDAIAPDRDREINLIYSSGTTGRPKGIVQSEGMRIQHAQALAAMGFGCESVMLLSTTHYSNWTLAGTFGALYAGATMVLAEDFEPTRYMDLVRQRGVTHALFVPVQLERLLGLADFDERARHAPVMKLCAGSPLPAQTKRELLRRWPGGLIENYGLTEGAPSTLLIAAQFPSKLASVGTPLAGGEIRIIDEAGHSLPVGAVGEVVGRTAAMMSGYHNLPEASHEIEWHDAEGRRFFRSGDLGYLDADGFLYIVGRRKDVIISGGANVYPVDIEAVLAAHPDVAEVAVIGIPSERWGETPLALVVPRTHPGPDPAALLAWANERLGKTQRLAALEFRESLPRGALDKVLKDRLREPYWREHWQRKNS